jgi:chitin synthase
MLIVVKTGHPREARDRKPGNRGKRDSQMILMNFISRVNYNDPFSPLDYDIFRKIQVLCGVTADYFELVSARRWCDGVAMSLTNASILSCDHSA